ncbi:DNA-binding NarL/FixJ family response regulator [Rhodoligotrophos appendicifer]|uniref:response regulator n=1 Tax=Rhodoligotrophos appendicifer TaxID=987056 RepID=UPI00118545AD|nr:response regulator transcription factor [Rhodoligotrophos appendicifer]
MISPAGRPVSVVIADDHPLVLTALRDLIAVQSAFEVSGVASTGTEALDLILRTEANLAILDITMPGMSGIEVLQALNRSPSPARIIFLTATITDAQIVDAIVAGVWGILRKESAPDTLLDCLHTVSEMRKWLPPDLIQPALARRAERDRVQGSLTSREIQIAELIAEGHPNKVIARKLQVSEGTVKIHLHNIYQKLHMDNRTTLAAKALSWRDR